MSRNTPFTSARRFLAILYFSAREEWQKRWNLVGRVLFFSVILFIWSRIWLIGADKLVGEASGLFTASNITWYIAVTELVALSISYVYIAIEQDIRSGDFAAQRARPMSYLAMQLAKTLGISFMQFLLLAVIGTFIIHLYVGGWPWPQLGLLERLAFGGATVMLAFFGLGIASIWYVTLGIASVWVEEVTPLAWIVQKLTFLLGGLVVPLALYPETLRTIALWSPFSAIMGQPASLVLQPDWPSVGAVAVKLFFWLALSLFGARAVHQRANAYVDYHG